MMKMKIQSKSKKNFDFDDIVDNDKYTSDHQELSGNLKGKDLEIFNLKKHINLLLKKT